MLTHGLLENLQEINIAKGLRVLVTSPLALLDLTSRCDFRHSWSAFILFVC